MTPILPPPLVCARPAGGRLKVSADALAVMLAHAQHAPTALEAGGVLLGRLIAGTADLVVDAVTPPMPGDRRSRTSFRRAARRHQEAIDRAWHESGETTAWLGEWHTHPEADPTPSGIDWKDWHRKLVEDRFAGPLLFIIVGTRAVRVWEGRRPRKIRPLEPFV